MSYICILIDAIIKLDIDIYIKKIRKISTLNFENNKSFILKLYELTFNEKIDKNMTLFELKKLFFARYKDRNFSKIKISCGLENKNISDVLYNLQQRINFISINNKFNKIIGSISNFYGIKIEAKLYISIVWSSSNEMFFNSKIKSSWEKLYQLNAYFKSYFYKIWIVKIIDFEKTYDLYVNEIICIKNLFSKNVNNYQVLNDICENIKIRQDVFFKIIEKILIL